MSWSWKLLSIAVMLPLFGCMEEAKPPTEGLFQAGSQSVEQESSSNELKAASQLPEQSPEAIFDQALIAIGGIPGMEQITSGKVVFTVSNKMAGIPDGLSNPLVTVYYAAPEKDRREIQADADSSERTILIKNGTQSWSGNQDGVGQLVPTSPAASAIGPFTIGTIGNILSLKDGPQTLKVENDDEGQTVVGAYSEDELTTLVAFDKISHLPVKVVSFAYSFQEGKIVGPVVTTVRLTDYKQFGPVVLPSRVASEQGGTEVMVVSLLTADFESEIDPLLFRIPE